MSKRTELVERLNAIGINFDVSELDLMVNWLRYPQELIEKALNVNLRVQELKEQVDTIMKTYGYEGQVPTKLSWSQQILMKDEDYYKILEWMSETNGLAQFEIPDSHWDMVAIFKKNYRYSIKDLAQELYEMRDQN